MRVGVDLVEVFRIRGLVDRRGERALHRLFSHEELAYALQASRPLAFQRLAARFAAKEAFRKALGKAVPFGEMEVVVREGAPWLRWQGRDYPLSLTHTPDLAVAVVLVDPTCPDPSAP